MRKNRRLFCELSPAAYRISAAKCCFVRRMQDALRGTRFAETFSGERLPVVICKNRSLIRRTLGNVDPALQENKAVNLGLAAPKVTGVLIRPGEEFSFWRLVGPCREQDGYKTGLVIAKGVPGKGIGGGMCQFTNLIHWLVLHSPLTITEHHHHDGVDLFPDHNRQIPFGTGTSIFYNYVDYRFRNDTDNTFQLIVSTDDAYLCGELRAEKPLCVKYHIKTEGERFVREADGVYRLGRIWRETVDVRTGNVIARECIKENHAKLMYEPDPAKIEPPDGRNG